MQGMVTLEKKGIKIAITHLPSRKKPCLAVQIGNCITKVASFNSEETSDWFIEILEEMFGERREDGEIY